MVLFTPRAQGRGSASEKRAEQDGRWPYVKKQSSQPRPRKSPAHCDEGRPLEQLSISSERLTASAPTLAGPFGEKVRCRGRKHGTFYCMGRGPAEAPAAIGGPFFDVEEAGGSRRGFNAATNQLPQRYALMRPCASKRFGGAGGESFGLTLSTPATIGPGTYAPDLALDALRKWDGSGPPLDTPVAHKTRGNMVFKSGQPRIDAGVMGWQLLHGRTAEVDGGVLDADRRLLQRRFNGSPKGVVFSRATRLV